jgi:hypothetical protein
VAAALLDSPLRAASSHSLGRGVARIESRYENVGQQQQTRAAGVVFVESAQDAGSEELAEGGTRLIKALVDRLA